MSVQIWTPAPAYPHITKPEQLKDKMLRAAPKARNYFSHDLFAFAEPSDALDSIGDAVDFSLKLQRL
jgi:hypothetical protein